MRRTLPPALLLLATCTTGCVTTYYKHVKTDFQVNAGGGGTPGGDSGALNPTVVEVVLSYPGSTIYNYYKTIYSWRQTEWPASSVFTQVAYRNVILDQNEMNRRYDAGLRAGNPGVAKHEVVAREAARIIAPHVVRAIKEKGHARVTWGQKLGKNPPELKLPPNMFYVTLDRARSVLRVHDTDIFTAWKSPAPREYDLSAVPGAMDAGAQLRYETVAAQIKLPPGEEPLGPPGSGPAAAAEATAAAADTPAEAPAPAPGTQPAAAGGAGAE